jgi:hypothetical protein
MVKYHINYHIHHQPVKKPYTTLNCSIGVGHSNSLEPHRFSTHAKALVENQYGPHYMFFSRKLMWVTILFYSTFVPALILKVLVRSLQEDYGKDTFTLFLNWVDN